MNSNLLPFPNAANLIVAQFAESMFVTHVGLEPWAQMPLASAASDVAFWRQLLRSLIIPPPLAEALRANPEAFAAMVKALNEPDIAGSSKMIPEGAPLEGHPYLKGPAYCVFIGVPLSDDDDEFSGEDIAAWDPVVVLADCRESAAEAVQQAVIEERPSRPRVVVNEAQLRGLAVRARRVALGQTPPDDPVD
ncbi:MAG: hypothetical protein IAE82_06555 [Opitutaceae bacterium]|nr:hypothetical protein [Opitutaceae bacterium]